MPIVEGRGLRRPSGAATGGGRRVRRRAGRPLGDSCTGNWQCTISPVGNQIRAREIITISRRPFAAPEPHAATPEVGISEQAVAPANR
jgi:hypothetical protein